MVVITLRVMIRHAERDGYYDCRGAKGNQGRLRDEHNFESLFLAEYHHIMAGEQLIHGPLVGEAPIAPAPVIENSLVTVDACHGVGIGDPISSVIGHGRSRLRRVMPAAGQSAYDPAGYPRQKLVRPRSQERINRLHKLLPGIQIRIGPNRDQLGHGSDTMPRPAPAPIASRRKTDRFR